METDDTLRILLVVIAVILLAPLALMVVAMPLFGLWGGHMWGGGMRGLPGAELLLVTGAFGLALLLGIGYLLYRVARRPTDGETDPAIQELRTAYARGDLTDEEFEQRRERLRRDQ
jgi:putative membrane protein